MSKRYFSGADLVLRGFYQSDSISLFFLVISVYDVLTGKIVTRLNGHRACVRDVSWHPYENKLISTSVSTIKQAHQHIRKYNKTS